MPLFLANPNAFLKECTNFKMGAKQVKKIYQGTKLVWESFKGFTFEGEKKARYRIVYETLPETDPTKFKNMWAIVDGVDRLIWESTSTDYLEIDTRAAAKRVTIYNQNGSTGTFTMLDTGAELPNGTYTFKVELI